MDAARPKMDYEGLLEFAEINGALDASDRRPSTGLSTRHPEPIQAFAPSLQCMRASAIPRG